MSYKPEEAMMIKLDYELPEYPAFEEGIRRAPRRESHLSQSDKALAIKNALRYIHPDHHQQMAKEFAQELEEHGRIYGYRFRPAGKLHGNVLAAEPHGLADGPGRGERDELLDGKITLLETLEHLGSDDACSAEDCDYLACHGVVLSEYLDTLGYISES